MYDPNVNLFYRAFVPSDDLLTADISLEGTAILSTTEESKYKRLLKETQDLVEKLKGDNETKSATLHKEKELAELESLETFSSEKNNNALEDLQ
jgi:hypothetical protein